MLVYLDCSVTFMCVYISESVLCFHMQSEFVSVLVYLTFQTQEVPKFNNFSFYTFV